MQVGAPPTACYLCRMSAREAGHVTSDSIQYSTETDTGQERSLLWQVETPLKVELLRTNVEIMCMGLVMSRLIWWEAETCWENQTLELSHLSVSAWMRGRDGCHAEESLCVCLIQLQHFSREHQRGEAGGQHWGSLSCHLRTPSLLLDSCPDILH